MNCCSLVHHVSGVCSTCPNNEECELKVIIEMQKVLDHKPCTIQEHFESLGPIDIGDSID